MTARAEAARKATENRDKHANRCAELRAKLEKEMALLAEAEEVINSLD